MTTTQAVTFTFDIEINDLAALQRFNSAPRSHSMNENGEVHVDERQQVTRAVAHVAADAFTALKLETGLRLRSISLVE